MLTPSERTLRARIAAHAKLAKHDAVEATSNARAAARRSLDERLLAAVDPERRLPAAERERRLAHARKAHYARLALKSARKRRRKGERNG